MKTGIVGVVKLLIVAAIVGAAVVTIGCRSSAQNPVFCSCDSVGSGCEGGGGCSSADPVYDGCGCV